jgi:hypothetical protein
VTAPTITPELKALLRRVKLGKEDGWVGRWRGAVPAGRCGVSSRSGFSRTLSAPWAGRVRFQRPPVEPCVRFSRTRLTDVLHRVAFGFSRQGRFGLGATTHPLRLTRPIVSGERYATTLKP